MDRQNSDQQQPMINLASDYNNPTLEQNQRMLRSRSGSIEDNGRNKSIKKGGALKSNQKQQ